MYGSLSIMLVAMAATPEIATWPLTTSGTPVLPAWCYNPPGDNCRWYRECLAAQFRCEDTNSSYALGYGEKMCNRFTSAIGEFSPLGQKWMKTARMCLQKELVPLLTRNMSCSEQKTFAFRTHPTCYADAPYGGVSFCELPLTDWLRASWIIKETFITDTGDTLSQVASILGKCASKGTSSLFG